MMTSTALSITPLVDKTNSQSEDRLQSSSLPQATEDTVWPHIMKMDGFTVTVSEQTQNDKKQYVVNIKLERTDIDVYASNIIASLISPTKKTEQRSIPLIDEHTWELPLTNLKEDGVYQLSLAIQAKTTKAEAVELTSESLSFEHTGSEKVTIPETEHKDLAPVIPAVNKEAAGEAKPKPSEKPHKPLWVWILIGVGTLIGLGGFGGGGYWAFKKFRKPKPVEAESTEESEPEEPKRAEKSINMEMEVEAVEATKEETSTPVPPPADEATP
jgi:hypothetical protein